MSVLRMAIRQFLALGNSFTSVLRLGERRKSADDHSTASRVVIVFIAPLCDHVIPPPPGFESDWPEYDPIANTLKWRGIRFDEMDTHWCNGLLILRLAFHVLHRFVYRRVALFFARTIERRFKQLSKSRFFVFAPRRNKTRRTQSALAFADGEENAVAVRAAVVNGDCSCGHTTPASFFITGLRLWHPLSDCF